MVYFRSQTLFWLLPIFLKFIKFLLWIGNFQLIMLRWFFRIPIFMLQYFLFIDCVYMYGWRNSFVSSLESIARVKRNYKNPLEMKIDSMISSSYYLGYWIWYDCFTQKNIAWVLLIIEFPVLLYKENDFFYQFMTYIDFFVSVTQGS